MFHFRTLLSAALFAAFSLAASPVAAAAAPGTVAIQSGDLNLTSDAGRAILRQRIAHAVDRVCGPAHPRTTADVQAYASCRAAAQANAGVQYEAMVANAEMKVAARTNRPVE